MTAQPTVPLSAAPAQGVTPPPMPRTLAETGLSPVMMVSTVFLEEPHATDDHRRAIELFRIAAEKCVGFVTQRGIGQPWLAVLRREYQVKIYRREGLRHGVWVLSPLLPGHNPGWGWISSVWPTSQGSGIRRNLGLWDAMPLALEKIPVGGHTAPTASSGAAVGTTTRTTAASRIATTPTRRTPTTTSGFG